MRACQVAEWWRILPPMQETQVQSLGGEDPLEEETATHSSILAWEILRTEEPGGLQSTGPQRDWHNRAGVAVAHFLGRLFPSQKSRFWELENQSPLRGPGRPISAPAGLGCYVLKPRSLYSSLLRSDPLRSVWGNCGFTAAPRVLRLLGIPRRQPPWQLRAPLLAVNMTSAFRHHHDIGMSLLICKHNCVFGLLTEFCYWDPNRQQVSVYL